mmetsp:Transcript_88644/g.251270  ORF Transcript_88644/g.251270 Transcript_88644/m.251270 type:complete len:209 (-) Transcript_88644:16-642(-)
MDALVLMDQVVFHHHPVSLHVLRPPARHALGHQQLSALEPLGPQRPEEVEGLPTGQQQVPEPLAQAAARPLQQHVPGGEAVDGHARHRAVGPVGHPQGDVAVRHGGLRGLRGLGDNTPEMGLLPLLASHTTCAAARKEACLARQKARRSTCTPSPTPVASKANRPHPDQGKHEQQCWWPCSGNHQGKRARHWQWGKRHHWPARLLIAF